MATQIKRTEAQIRLDYHSAQEAKYRALGMPKMAAFHQKRREALEATPPCDDCGAPAKVFGGAALGFDTRYCVDCYAARVGPARPERTVYGTRIGRHWAFVVASYGDLLRFTGETATAEYPCEACGADQMTLVHLMPTCDRWVMRCTDCGKHYEVSEMPARQCNGQGE